MSGSNTPPDDASYHDTTKNSSPTDDQGESSQHGLASGEAAEVTGPKPKRIACIICRKRKLRCDGTRPSCGTCSRLGHQCAYDEVRRKSGPKRGYVKELEMRLQQVETQLKSKDSAVRRQNGPPIPQTSSHRSSAMGGHDMLSGFASATSNPLMPSVTVTPSDTHNTTHPDFPWEMVSLGFDEALPPQDMIEELHQIYFDTIHKSLPMIHKYRYLAALNLAPHMRPAICLRYAMWALVCSVTDKYYGHADTFYRRARKYAELDEMKGHGECFVTVGHSQCWTLVATYEFKMMYFPRAWMSVGRAARLAQMLNLQRLDGAGLEVKQTIAPPRDWTEREERRRTFWMAYCNDRYASIGTGWPMVFEEKDILTNLPAANEAYEKSQPEDSMTLADAMTTDGAQHLSTFAGVVVIASLFGRNLMHLHRSSVNDRPEDTINGDFWKRHKELDGYLTSTMLFLPEHLQIPNGNKDPNVPFLNMSIQASVICLHQAAILKAEKHDLDINLIKQSVDRCFAASERIVDIMRLTSHLTVSSMNPFLAFCLYVAARVLTHAYKKRPTDEAIKNNLEFLLNAMQAHRKRNQLTESFLVQLTVELEAAGLEIPIAKPSGYRSVVGIPRNQQADCAYQTQSHLGGNTCPTVFQRPTETQPSFHELRSRPPVLRGSPIPSSSRDDRGSQYSMSSFTMPSRARRSSLQNSHNATGPIQMQGVVMAQAWPQHNPNVPENAAIDPYHIFDTEMSSEGTNEPVGFSGHPTPTTSHHASSHTSYSPRQEDHLDITQAANDRPMQPGQAPYYSTNQFQTYTTAETYPTQRATAASSDYEMSGAWEMAAAASSMAPTMGDSAWGALDGIAWTDSNPMDVPPMESWRGIQGNMHGVTR